MTGGASGIGRATVERFLNDGANVTIFDINDISGAEVVTWAESKGLKVSFYHVDVAHKDECESAVAKVAIQDGQIHYLVNSAVYFGSKGLTAEEADWQKTFSVNVTGYANMVQAVHPYMSTTREGAVVNVSSISGHRAQPNRWTYAASKGAILSMTKFMALDLSTDNIRVNSVSPGWIWSPEGAKPVNGDREKQLPLMRKIKMLRRHGETSEVAAVITFLCSKDASFITGTDVPVDGGYLAMSPEQHGQESSFSGTNY